MYCPECGSDAGEAKFCPECGNDLGVLRRVMRKSGTPSGAARTARPRRAPSSQTESRGTNPAYLWGAVGAIAIAVIAGVWIVNRSPSDSKTAQTPPPPPVSVDTSGSYDQLVVRANTLLDQGYALLQQSQGGFSAEALPYFNAADKTYAAAWKKRSDDPNVATDWSFVIFESGDTDAAVAKTDMVIARWPGFQAAYHHRGLFLMMEFFRADRGSRATAALRAEARAALEKAIQLDPDSPFGREAATFLLELDSPAPAGTP